MNFLAPAAFAFAAALPVVVVFYLLKRKRVVKLISSTILWQKFLAETQASAPFQRLRHNWLLVFQLLLLILAILALARPYFAGKSSGGNLFVAILDASASMQSTDESPTRFEKVRNDALNLVGSMHETDQMLVLQAGATTEVKQSTTSDKGALRRAILACAAMDSPTRLADALKLAESTTRNNPNAEIHLFTDGATSDLSGLENRGMRIVFHGVGKRCNNLGIISLDVRPNPEDASRRAVFASVGNYSTNVQQTEIELVFNNQLIETRSLTLKPRETLPQVFIASQGVDGIFTVRITARDDLAADNQASIISLLPQPMKILLITSGNNLLAKALRAVPGVELAVAESLNDSAKGFDVVVLDNVTPLVWPAPNVLAIHVVNTNLFTGWANSTAPPIVGWKGTHPLLRFVSFDNVAVVESLAVKVPVWATTVVESPQIPLILAGELNRQRIAWVGFDILNSTWPLRVSFPIFIENAVEWLNPASANAALLTVRAGDPFRYLLPDTMVKPQILPPNGTPRPISLDPNSRELIFGDTTKQGIYRVQSGTNELSFCVNVLDALESDTTPRAELTLGKYTKVKTTTESRASLEIWRWFAMAALAISMFEWWYYHRRTA